MVSLMHELQRIRHLGKTEGFKRSRVSRCAVIHENEFAGDTSSRGGRRARPIDDIESYCPAEKAQAMNMLARSIVGSPETVRSGLRCTGCGDGCRPTHHRLRCLRGTPKRLRSFELIASAAGIAR